MKRFISQFNRYMYPKFGLSLFLIIRLGFGCLFIWSSLPKLRHPYDFLSSVYGYELVGPKLGMFTAMVIPWIELLVGICLIGGVFVSGALLTCVVLLAIFSFCHGSVLYRGLAISCGCFSTSSPDLISYTTLIRTCVIWLTSIVAYVCSICSSNLSPPRIL